MAATSWRRLSREQQQALTFLVDFRNDVPARGSRAAARRIYQLIQRGQIDQAQAAMRQLAARPPRKRP
jgi:DNA-binding FadR family transcriptional regulator